MSVTVHASGASSPAYVDWATMSFPTNTSGVAAGDVMVIAVMHGKPLTMPAQPTGGAGGWTSTRIEAGTQDGATTVYRKALAAGDISAGSVSFNFGTLGGQATGGWWVLKGAQDAWAVTPSGQSGFSTSMTMPAATSVPAGAAVLRVVQSTGGGARTYGSGQPTGHTIAWTTTGSAWAQSRGAHLITASAGTVAQASCSINTNTNWLGVTFVVPQDQPSLVEKSASDNLAVGINDTGSHELGDLPSEFPQVVWADAFYHNGPTLGTSAQVLVPSGAQAGDWCFIIAHLPRDQSISSTGFGQVFRYSGSTEEWFTGHQVLAKQLVSGDINTNKTVTLSSAFATVLGIVVIRNTKKVVWGSASTWGWGGNTMTAPAVASAPGNSLVLRLYSSTSETQGAFYFDFLSQHTLGYNNSAIAMRQGGAYHRLIGASPASTGQADLSTSQNANIWVASTLVIEQLEPTVTQVTKTASDTLTVGVTDVNANLDKGEIVDTGEESGWRWLNLVPQGIEVQHSFWESLNIREDLPPVENPKLDQVSDAFSGTTINPMNWTAHGLAEQSDTLQLPVVWGSGFSAVRSRQRYDAVSSQAHVQLVQAATGTGVETRFTLEHNASNRISFVIAEGELLVRVVNGGANTNAAVVAHSSQHRWLRFLVGTTTATIQVSPTGLEGSWNNIAQVQRYPWLDDVTVVLEAGATNQVSPSLAVFDDFNVDPSTDHVRVDVPTMSAAVSPLSPTVTAGAAGDVVIAVPTMAASGRTFAPQTGADRPVEIAASVARASGRALRPSVVAIDTTGPPPGLGAISTLLDGLAPGIPYEIEVAAFDKGGRTGGWSTTTTVAQFDTIPPSQPGPPIVAGSALHIQVRHNLGKASGGTFNLEDDLAFLEVHVGTTQTFTANAGTVVGTLIANRGMLRLDVPVIGTFPVDDAEPRWVRVIAVDHAGNRSDPSEAASVTAQLIDALQISSIDASTIVTGTLDASLVNVVNLNFEDATGGTLSADRITGGTLRGVSISIGGTLGVPNFAVDGAGNTTIRQGTIRLGGDVSTHAGANFAVNNSGSVNIRQGSLSIGTDASGQPMFNVASTGAVTARNISVLGGMLEVGSNFRVTNAGILTASGATINGNITVTSGSIALGNSTLTPSGRAFNVSTTGQVQASNIHIYGGSLRVGTRFEVTSAGALTATGGTFSGAIVGGSINIGANFSVSSTGIMTARAGTFEGNITSDSIITGALYRTATSGARIVIDGRTTTTRNRITFVNDIGESSFLSQGLTTGLWTSGSFRVRGFCYIDNAIQIAHSTRNWRINTGTDRIVLQQDASGTMATSYTFTWGSTAWFTAASSGATLGRSAERWGGVFLTASPNVSSDMRLKDILGTAPGLELVGKLRPISYRLLDRPQQRHWGFAAQELEPHVPDDAGVISRPDDNQDHYGLAYEELMAPMVRAIQELEARLRRLEQGDG